jgi:hypothetical protein
VDVPADASMRHDLAMTSPDEELTTEVADLLGEVAGLRVALARAEAGSALPGRRQSLTATRHRRICARGSQATDPK